MQVGWAMAWCFLLIYIGYALHLVWITAFIFSSFAPANYESCKSLRSRLDQ